MEQSLQEHLGACRGEIKLLKKTLEKAQQSIVIYKGLLALEEATVLRTVLYAKEKLEQAGQLQHEPCLWCVTPLDQITEERLTELGRKYKVNIEFEGFHCANHRQLMHDVLGPHEAYWSCCKEPELAEEETATASQHSE